MAFALVVTLAAGGCATGARPARTASQEERAAYAAAIGVLEDDPAVAGERLRAFLGDYPESPLADDAAFQLAGMAAEAGDREGAAQWLRMVVERYAEEDRADAARVALARLEVARGLPDRARAQLAGVRFERLDEDGRREALRLLATLATHRPEKLQWLARLRELAPPEAVPDLDEEIDALLVQMTVRELEQSVDGLGRRAPAARARLRLAERLIESGELEDADRQLARAERMELLPPDEALLEEVRLHYALRERIAGTELLPSFAEVAALPAVHTEGARGSLGVVLPLSGPFAEYGEESLRGVLLAAHIFDEIESGPAADRADEGFAPLQGDGAPGQGRAGEAEAARVRVLVRDSAGDPDRAAAAVRELGAREEVAAIVGPLLSAECEAAGIAAEEAGIPLVTLTGNEEVPPERTEVFRIGTTPSDEVGFLVDYAVDELGAERFAIFYPKDSFGLGMRERFWEAVEARGGHVVAVGSYDPDATDFTEPLRRMVGYELLTPAERKALEERERFLQRARRMPPEEAAEARELAYGLLGPEGEPLPPIVDFDALFIPDSHDKIVLIAPQLAFNEITDTQLLGTGGWNHPDLVKIARKHVRGAVISAPFYAESPFVFVSSFVDDYEHTFAARPDSFAAQAFDAANLVLVQLAGGRSTRGAVREGLLRTHAYPGVSGILTMLPDGNARKRPFLLQVRGSKIVPLD